jgi:hypothetical protein
MQAAIRAAVNSAISGKFISNRSGTQFLDRGQRAYLAAWKHTWELPRRVVNCGPLSQCTAVNLQLAQANYRKAVVDLEKVSRELSARLKKAGKRTERITRRLDNSTKAAMTENLRLLGSVAASTAQCG